MWLERRKLAARSGGGARLAGRRFPSRRGAPDGARSSSALTAVNIVIVLLAGYGGLHAMESPSFCGQACHTPMHPQFTAWQGAPHARRRLRRMSHRRGRARLRAREAGRRPAARRWSRPARYPRPIPPGAKMPPGAQAETVRELPRAADACIGDRIRVIREYADDEANTETMTVLQMHLGVTTSSPRGDSLARRSRRSHRVRGDRRGAADDSVRQGHRRERPGQGVRRRGTRRAGRPPRPSDARWTASIATTRSGIPSRRRRSRPSIGPSPPRWSAARSRLRGARASGS